MKGKELIRKIASAEWLVSQVQDFCLKTWDSFSQDDFANLYRSVRGHTMSSNARLRGLYSAIKSVADRDVAGDIVECGTARGGSAALMGLALKRVGQHRRLWVFDTFEGLPPPSHADPDYEIARLYTGSCRGDLAEVTVFFGRIGILDHTTLVKGLFQDTLPASGIGTIAVLHIDGDWYESVKVCLEHLYERVSTGGVIQIDDYGYWAGARKAVDEFLLEHSIDVHLRRLDYTGRQFTKPD